MAPAERSGAETADTLARRAWEAAGLPSASGALGPPQGPWIRQLLGSFAPGDDVPSVVARAVRADAEARFLALGGHRVSGTLRAVGEDPASGPAGIGELLVALGIWTGGTGVRPWDDSERTSRVQLLLERLASRGIVALRPGTLRLCPRCRAMRSPERTVYREQIGDTFLVRFPLEGPGVLGDALAWVDAPWRLLGCTALLVNPDLPYVVVEYQRDGAKASLLLARSAVERIGAWLPGGTLRVVRELKGRELVGIRYVHPLRHEYPRLATLEAPASSVQAVLDVGDSGTGVVPLVPAHGGTDAGIAERLGVPSLPLLTDRGTLDASESHKFASLELEAANEFVLRDLTEGGHVFARLRVLRGVPFCAVCGGPVVWVPGRTWRLDLGKVPSSIADRYSALLPGEPSFSHLDLTAWPVSTGGDGSADEGTVRLSECSGCDRLLAPGSEEACACGGTRADRGRMLLPTFEGTLAAWSARGAEAEISLFVNERRRVPSVVYHLVAMASLDAEVGDLALRLVPTSPEVALAEALAEHGPDAVRAALLLGGGSRRRPGAFADRAKQERRRLDALLELAREVATARGRLGGGALSSSTLAPIDRAVLARFGEVDHAAIGHYETGEIDAAYRRLERFLEYDLVRYRSIVGFSPGATSSTAPDAVGALPGLLESIAALLAPVAPFTAEALRVTLAPGETPLFSRTPFSLEAPPTPAEPLLRWQEWTAVLHAIDRFRAERRLPPDAPLERVAVIVDDEAVGARLRADGPGLERAGRIARFEVGSPEHPWVGKLQRIVPVEEEVAKAYPAIAPQVVHLLRRLPPRGPGGRDPLHNVSVVVAGLPRPIAPHMLKVSDELPPGVVRRSFSLGELFVLPPGPPPPASVPGLSPDAAWVYRRLARRVRLSKPSGTGEPTTALAILPEPLSSELTARASEIASALGLAGVEVRAEAPALLPPNRLGGRSRSGHRWSVYLFGLLPPAPRRKRRASMRRELPIVIPAGSRTGPEATDFLDPGVLAREEGIRALAEEIDGALGVPAVGPAKAASAWDAGYRSVQGIVEAPFEKAASLQGFGRAIASGLFASAGRPVPAPVASERRARRPAGANAPIVRAPAPVPVRPPAPRPVEAPPTRSVESPIAAPATPRPQELTVPSPSGLLPVAPREPVVSPPAPAAVPAAPEGPTPDRAPDVHAAPPPPRPAQLRPGQRYGVELGGYSSFTAAALPFLEATASGHRGLAIVHGAFDRMRLIVGTRKVALRRLSGGGLEDAIDPHDLGRIATTVADAYDRDGVRAVFLEGFEVLVELHGFDAAVRWLEELDRWAKADGVRIWVHLNEPLLGPGRVAGLRRTFAGDAGPVSGGLEPSDAALYHG